MTTRVKLPSDQNQDLAMEHRKESDANVQLLKAQVNWVESLLAQVLKNMAPFELAQSNCSS
ncbi:hypothetical protein ACB092_11G187300 [Castanea dentata]